VNPELILDRTEACRKLGISRQTLISWIRKGKLKVWKRVGHGSNAALLFERKHIDHLSGSKQAIIPNNSGGNSENEKIFAS
jgi:predicted site-specific integrase-resolvase